MTEAVEEDCLVYNASDGARERLAVTKVAAHVRELARRDADHQVWIDEHTGNATLTEIREALADHGWPKN